MIPSAPQFHSKGSLSLFYSQTSLRHLTAEFRQPCSPLETWLIVDFDLTPDPKKLAFAVTETGEPEALDALVNQLNTTQKVCQRVLQAFDQHKVKSASGIVAVFDQAYDGRFQGTRLLRFLGTVGLD